MPDPSHTPVPTSDAASRVVVPPPGGSPSSATVRAAGALLAGGATAWAVGTLVVGDAVLDGVQVLDTVTGLAYVAGLVALVLVLRAARLTGNRFGRILAAVTVVVLAGAFLVNVLSLGYDHYDEFPQALMALDACWPLGQLLVLLVGVVVAVAGRVRGLLRWQPLLCGLWFPVSTLAQIILGPADSVVVSAAWLLLAPTVLGVRLVLRPRDLVS
ncbi:hypothetical protein [Pseudonocardia sp. N23]|uniref:hypothetical protein n=1 Tax=Pseudonocardia sp. N23 TaxID=1987376 RepID=UPI000C026842|nr:hypothetical protein [Pseudonocardia sp. N23]GAY13143.1 hypothetical protein TOK_2062 [Pseudonocardia sp. N23]